MTEVHHTRGDLSYVCNTASVQELVDDWSWTKRHCAPKSVEYVTTPSFKTLIESIHIEAERDWLARRAFPVAYVAAKME